MKTITKNDIVLSGKAMYARVHEPMTTEFDGKKDTLYQMVLQLDAESEAKVLQMSEGLKLIDGLTGTIKELKRNEQNIAEVRIKKKAMFVNRNNETITVDPIKVFDKSGNLNKELIGNGSDVTVHAKIGLFEKDSIIYPFFQFKYIKLHNLVEYKPKKKLEKVEVSLDEDLEF